ncbi:MAG: hypothetical protein OXU20_16995 [Myxococcales bacterium]|nr:hypothetical protein [Myxococcales bacterium]MDD9968579.1 hypothetical protein [Myxococcales bacterium]
MSRLKTPRSASASTAARTRQETLEALAALVQAPLAELTHNPTLAELGANSEDLATFQAMLSDRLDVVVRFPEAVRLDEFTVADLLSRVEHETAICGQQNLRAPEPTAPAAMQELRR